MRQKLSLAYSTCPNDTFIFHALAHGLVECGGLSFDIALHDVERLNQDAAAGVYDISKLSFAAIGHLRERYALLSTGAALGRGCGPLIVAKPSVSLTDTGRKKVAVPGLWTTANMLLSLFLPESPEVIPMTFDRIMPAVSDGTVDFGVIIHEGRFTYGEYGLECLQDLGQWWEEETGLPIPLGGIAIRRDLAKETAAIVEKAIGDSVKYAKANPNASAGYIRHHAQELSAEVTSQHIELYVNDFSIDLGDEGVRAIETLFERAEAKGLIPPSDTPFFLSR